MNEVKDRWSDCEQVFFCNGWGWGLTQDLQSVCLGKEEDVQLELDTGELKPDLNTLQRQILSGILEYRKENGIGTGENNMVGGGSNGIVGNKQKRIGHTASRQRLTMRASKQKNKGLLCR